jgi:hypothetical protein
MRLWVSSLATHVDIHLGRLRKCHASGIGDRDRDGLPMRDGNVEAGLTGLTTKTR